MLSTMMVLTSCSYSPYRMSGNNNDAMISTMNDKLDVSASGSLVSNDVAMYPRAVVLQHSGAGVNGRILVDATSWNPAGIGAIYMSTDNGTSFNFLGAVADPLASGGICCTTLFELPIQIGNMPPGTLLWAGSIGQSIKKMTIRMWASRDGGKTWAYVSSPAVAANAGGLWEPEFSVTVDGQLVCHFSDETEQPRYSQLLQEVFSKDGLTWSQRYPTVASTNPGNRPGMANVRQLGPSLWIMTYELCGVGGRYECAAHFRTSPNGANWGPPTDLGILMEDAGARFFAHAPTIAFSPERNLLAMTGQILCQNSNGAIVPGSGATIFVTDPTLKVWTARASPVSVPDARNDPCPNYSSGLVFLDHGARLMQVATDYQGSACKAYHNTINV
eukprot:TRINITY_DN792_c0_g2_i1.p1 TRINITY_DN792_c0_g2~~TRINITY_DN792_c0_g2_i1.p1  ORF type:complete len:419 (+),score=68.83 TRINITY_DN792_c0_g2_i1:96-1259(+)